MTEIILNGVSTEQLVNLIDERTQKALEEFKKEHDKQPLAKKRNDCDFLKMVLSLLRYIILFS